MRVVIATFCDYAAVRDGLLTIVSAGITRAWREDLPAPLNLAFALMLELDPSERSQLHDLEFRVTAPDGSELVRGGGGFQTGEAATPLDADEAVLFPIALDLRSAAVASYGWVTVTMRAGSIEGITVRVKVERRPTATTRPPMMRPHSGPH